MKLLAAEPRTMVFFESPHRSGDARADLATAFGPTRRAAVCRELTKLHEEVARGTLAALAAGLGARPAAVCRELTKLHEEIVRGSASELAARYASEDPRGEIVLVIGGAPPPSGVDPAAVEAVRRLVEGGAKPRVAASVVSDLTGAPANALYRAIAV